MSNVTKRKSLLEGVKGSVGVNGRSRFTEIYEVKHLEFTDFNSIFSLVTKIRNT